MTVTVEGVITDDRIPLVILSVGNGEVNHCVIKMAPTEARRIANDLVEASSQIEDDKILWDFLLDQGLGSVAEDFMHNLSRYRAACSARIVSPMKETKQ